MQKIFSIVIAALISASMFAAETEYLPISVYAAEDVEPFPQGAKALVENKLTQLLTRNGVAGLNYMGQFELTVTTTPLDKDVIAGPPAKIAEKMELNFYIVDAYAKTIFSSTSLTVRGLGETENKCYLDALNRIPLQSPQLAQFVREGKEKIIAYYNHEAARMIQQAQALARQKKYDEALALVALIPAQCDQYEAALAATLDIYQQYIDNECNLNLAAARQAWAAQQNAEGAAAAGQYLALITPDAGCYDEAMALYNEIKAKVLEDWQFEMKQYQDGVDIQKLQIEAARQIGIAYGNNQPNQTTNIEFLRTLL